MAAYLRETWDLHVAALVAFLCIGLLLYWCAAIPLLAVPVVVLLGALLSVFGGLWLLAIAGGTIPW